MDELEELAEMLLGAYALTNKLLSLLPIPIELPPIHTEESGGLLGAQAMERARIAMLDLPLDPVTTAIFRDLIFQWLIARDLCVLAVTVAPDPHRIYGLRAALARFSDLSMKAERQLGFDW